MSRRSKRSSIATKSYKEIDSDDEHEKFKSIVSYESGSDFEEDLKKQTLGDEEDESDSEPEDENKLIIDEDLGGTNNDIDSKPTPTMSRQTQRRPKNQKRVVEFPKCQLCNYRYFTRLDLCRHFVDYHLRQRLANCIDPHQLNCWGCPLVFEKKQTRLRHFIWSHQDLDRLVMENFKVRLSDFMPSLLDLEIRKIDPRILEVSLNHHWIELAGVGGVNQKVVMDLEALSLHEHIDVLEDEEMLKILTNPQCELCGLEFKTGSTNAKRSPILARDKKRQHLICHFRDVILKDLPVTRPFRCPKCPHTGKSLIDLTTHYGWNHNIVLAAMKEELGVAEHVPACVFLSPSKRTPKRASLVKVDTRSPLRSANASNWEASHDINNFDQLLLKREIDSEPLNESIPEAQSNNDVVMDEAGDDASIKKEVEQEVKTEPQNASKMVPEAESNKDVVMDDVTKYDFDYENNTSTKKEVEQEVKTEPQNESKRVQEFESNNDDVVMETAGGDVSKYIFDHENNISSKMAQEFESNNDDSSLQKLEFWQDIKSEPIEEIVSIQKESNEEVMGEIEDVSKNLKGPSEAKPVKKGRGRPPKNSNNSTGDPQNIFSKKQVIKEINSYPIEENENVQQESKNTEPKFPEVRTSRTLRGRTFKPPIKKT